MQRNTANAREKIIDAAEQVVIEVGARHLTLETVASKAGVSRGGLLYHFPDKEALLRGMLERRVRCMKESRIKKRSEIPAGLDREAVVYLLSVLGDDPGANRGVSAALIASAAHNPELLAPAREDYRQIMNDLTRDGLNFERAAVIMLATSGLRFLEVLAISPFTIEERGRIIKELRLLAAGNKGDGKEA